MIKKEDKEITTAGKGFSALLILQFLGSLNDNFFRSALAVLIVYYGSANPEASLSAPVLIALCSMLLVLPFPFISTISGQLADKMDKAKLIINIKLAECLIMSLGCYAFYMENITLLIFTLALSGVQSAFFGPVKYSIIADLVGEDRLVSANGKVSATTYLSVLLGLTLGGLVYEFDYASQIAGFAVIGAALLGLIASFFIPAIAVADSDKRVSYNIIEEALSVTLAAFENRQVYYAILGLSWFIAVSAIMMSQFPVYAKWVGADNEVYTLFLSVFTVGVSLGSLACRYVLKDKVTAIYAPLSALAMSLFIGLMMWQSTPMHEVEVLMGIDAFLAVGGNLYLLLWMFFTAFAGGIYVVPFYTLIQARVGRKERSRIIAARNIINSAFIVTAMLLAVLLLEMGLDVVALFTALACVNGVVVILLVLKLPDCAPKLAQFIEWKKGASYVAK
ncbi:MAG: MFS transporter [Rickettsiales bacterium]|nr:MFS transporter [Rickettsiales bacterium]